MTRTKDKAIAISAIVGVGQRSLQVVATLIIMPLVLDALGEDDFGIWGAVTSLAWLAVLADFGIGFGLLTLVTQSLGRDRIDEARALLTAALWLVTVLAATVVVCLIALMVTVPTAHGKLYIVAAGALALNAPLSLASHVWVSLQKGYVASAWEGLQTVLSMAGLLAAARLGTDLTLFVIVPYGALVAANLGAIGHLFLTHPGLRPDRLRVAPSTWRQVSRQGSAYFLLTLAGGMTYWLDNVLALEILGPQASAVMTVALRLCLAAFGLMYAVSLPLWPALTDAAVRSDWRWVRRTVVRGMVLVVVGSLVGVTILLVFGERVLNMWLHGNLNLDPGLLWAMAAWLMAMAVLRVPALLLNALSVMRLQIVATIVAGLSALALKVLLIEPLGGAGLLWGTTLAYTAVLMPSYAVWAYRHFGGRHDRS